MKTTKPTKQRKRLYQAPLNERYKRFSAPLSSKLKESHGTNSVPVRKGDTVMIMRGDRKGSEGKVTQISRKKYSIFVEGATREKVDGTTTLVPIHPSKVMITRLNLDDKWRKKILERKGVTEKVEIAEEEPPKKKAKKKSKTSKTTKKSGGT
jgi:large subunit ribosomal protein L24